MGSDNSDSRYNYSLRAGRSRHRILAGAKFFAPVQPGTGAHPDSCDHPPPPSSEVKERVEVYVHSPSGPSSPVLNELYLFFTLEIS